MTGTDGHEVAAAVDHLGESPQFAPLARSDLDLLPTELAIIDASGTIVYTNRAWRAFGEAIAASFDVSPPTFHQHLQVGLNKLLGSMYEASEE